MAGEGLGNLGSNPHGSLLGRAWANHELSTYANSQGRCEDKVKRGEML